MAAKIREREREREKGQMSEHLPERDSETAHSKREQHIESQKGMEDRRMGRVIDDDGKGTGVTGRRGGDYVERNLMG